MRIYDFVKRLIKTASPDQVIFDSAYRTKQTLSFAVPSLPRIDEAVVQALWDIPLMD